LRAPFIDGYPGNEEAFREVLLKAMGQKKYDLFFETFHQDQHWHSDNPTHKALLWKHKDFQDRTVVLWEAIARRAPSAAGPLRPMAFTYHPVSTNAGEVQGASGI
jgi:hypothetical protein